MKRNKSQSATVLLFSGVVLIGQTPAWAQIPVPDGFEIIGKRDVEYFIPDEGAACGEQSKLIDEKHVSTTLERRNETTRDVRELGTPVSTETFEDVKTITQPKFRRVEPPLISTLDLWRVDTIKTVTTKTPYTDFKLINYESRHHWVNMRTFEITKTCTFKDPLNGETLTQVEKRIRGPVEEHDFDAWVPREDKPQVGTGTLVSVQKTVVASRTGETLLSRTVSASNKGLSATGAYEGQDTPVLVDTFARVGEARRVVGITGAAKTQAKGGPTGGSSVIRADANLSGSWSHGMTIQQTEGRNRYLVMLNGSTIPAQFNTSNGELRGHSKTKTPTGSVENRVDLRVVDPAGNQLSGIVTLGPTQIQDLFVRMP